MSASLGAYYNEFDPFAAAWLRELIKAGHIAPGFVDERNIEDVVPDDLAEFIQCHFFAGIGVWSYALRRAGWPDDRPVWTGSCPCQPFSASGKRGGFADERHLWPAFFHLISQRRPLHIFGEQVASKDGLAWLDLVQTDLENAAYTVGAVDTCAAGFGAPHIRQRLYWVADSHRARHQGDGLQALYEGRHTEGEDERPTGLYTVGQLAHTASIGCQQRRRCIPASGCDGSAGDSSAMWMADPMPAGRAARRPEPGDGPVAGGGNIGGVGDTEYGRCEAGEPSRKWSSPAMPPSQVRGLGNSGISGLQNGQCASLAGEGRQHDGGTTQQPSGASGELEHRQRPGPANGHWRAADWLFCLDGRWRPVASGSFPLAHGAPARVGRLRGYGNALNAIQAEEFIRAYMAIQEEIQ